MTQLDSDKGIVRRYQGRALKRGLDGPFSRRFQDELIDLPTISESVSIRFIRG